MFRVDIIKEINVKIIYTIKKMIREMIKINQRVKTFTSIKTI